MAVQLAQNALVDLQTVKDELGVADTASDALLTRRINVASAAIEAYCDRKFSLVLEAEYCAVPATNPPRLSLKRMPVALVQSITESTDSPPGTLVDPDDYAIEDARAGLVYRNARWLNTALRRPDIVQDFEPDTERASTLVEYLGGYVTLPQALAAGAWPGAGATAKVGDLVGIGSTPAKLLWLCTTGGVLGGSQPAEMASAGVPATLRQQGLALGKTVTDGAATWAYLGTVGDVGAPGTAVSLPADLEQAALETVVMLWRRRGENTEVKSETVLGNSQTFGDRAQLAPSVISTLDKYKRWSVG